MNTKDLPRRRGTGTWDAESALERARAVLLARSAYYRAVSPKRTK